MCIFAPWYTIGQQNTDIHGSHRVDLSYLVHVACNEWIPHSTWQAILLPLGNTVCMSPRQHVPNLTSKNLSPDHLHENWALSIYIWIPVQLSQPSQEWLCLYILITFSRHPIYTSLAASPSPSGQSWGDGGGKRWPFVVPPHDWSGREGLVTRPIPYLLRKIEEAQPCTSVLTTSSNCCSIWDSCPV